VARIAFAPSGRAFFIQDGRIRCAGADCGMTALAGPAGVTAVAASADGIGLFAAVPSADGSRSKVTALDPASGEIAQVGGAGAPRDVEGRVTGLAATPDGRFLLAWGAAREDRRRDDAPVRGFVARFDLASSRSPQVLTLSGAPLDAALQSGAMRLWLLLPQLVQTVGVPAWSLSWSFAAPEGARSIALRAVDRTAATAPAGPAGPPIGTPSAEPILCFGGVAGVICVDPEVPASRGVLPDRMVVSIEAVLAVLVSGDGQSAVAVHAPRAPGTGSASLPANQTASLLRWDSRSPLSDAFVGPVRRGGVILAAGVDADGEIRLVEADSAAGSPRLTEVPPGGEGTDFESIRRRVAAMLPANPAPPPQPPLVKLPPPPVTLQPHPVTLPPPPAMPNQPPAAAPAAPVPPIAAPVKQASAPPPTQPSPVRDPQASAPPSTQLPPVTPPQAPAPHSTQLPPVTKPQSPPQVQPQALPTTPVPRDASPPDPTPLPLRELIHAEPPAPVAAPASKPGPPLPSTEAPDKEQPRGESPLGTGTILGTVSGSGFSAVEVVAFGPDSLLREAARVTPASDGGYRLASLSPGRYRVLVRGAASAPVPAVPAFRTVSLRPADAVRADFVLR